MSDTCLVVLQSWVMLQYQACWLRVHQAKLIKIHLPTNACIYIASLFQDLQQSEETQQVETDLWDGTLDCYLMVADGVSTRQNLVNIVSICKGDKSKASVSLLGSGWILGDVRILHSLWLSKLGATFT